MAQSNIYDGAFIAKIVSRSVYSQKSSFLDARLGSKYASAFQRLFKRFISLKYFTLYSVTVRLLNSVLFFIKLLLIRQKCY